jgi:hypothetical protein
VVEGGRELAVAIPDEKPEPVGVLVRGRSSGEVPALLVLFLTTPSRTGRDRFRSSGSPVTMPC